MAAKSSILLKGNFNGLILLAVVVVIKLLLFTAALECYTCDSNDDPECAIKPGQQIAVEECATETDECVQVIVAGITRRGCLTRIFPNRYCPEPCSRCRTSLCNRDIFPADRQRCYQCTGSDCVEVDKRPELILPCPIYKEDDRCFMNVVHASNVLRGCESSMGGDTFSCPNACVKCNRSGCNKEPGVTKQKCLQCAHNVGRPDPTCWRGQAADVAGKCVTSTSNYCENKNLYGHEGKCYSYINEQTGVVQRGCSSTKPFFTSGTLTECYGENCNTNCFTISCYICSSKEEPKCIAGQSLRMQKCEENTQSCFTCETGNQVTRGCADKNFLSQHSVNNGICYLCRNSNGCNKTSVRTCYSCSSLNNKECATMSSTEYITQRNCSSYNDLCASTIITKVQHSYVVRGCSSHLEECTPNDPLCVRCNGSLCNNVPIDLSSNGVIDHKLKLSFQ